MPKADHLKAMLFRLVCRLTACGRAQLMLDYLSGVIARLQGVGSSSIMSENGESRFLAKCLAGRSGAVVFDVGANKGDFTQHVLQRFPTANVHVFEPLPFHRLTLHGLFGAQGTVTLNELALSDAEGDATIHFDRDGSELASLIKRDLSQYNVEFEGAVTVKTQTLDNYCTQNNIGFIDFLKIDVEGHELAVLAGAKDMFANGKIGTCTLEFGGTDIDSRTFVRDFFKYFSQHNYALYRLTPGGYARRLYHYHEALERFQYTNFVALPLEKT